MLSGSLCLLRGTAPCKTKGKPMFDDDVSAAELLMMLVRFATVVSPAHAHAVTLYAMEHMDDNPDSPEFGYVLQTAVMSLFTAVEEAQWAAESVDCTMMMVPVPNHGEQWTGIRQYRDTVGQNFANLRMVDGVFVTIQPDDNDWPN